MLQYRYHGREKRIPGRFKFLANNLPGSRRDYIYSADLCLGRDRGWSRKYLPVCGTINYSVDHSSIVFFLNNSRYYGCLCSFVSEDDSRVTSHHQQDSGIYR